MSRGVVHTMTGGAAACDHRIRVNLSCDQSMVTCKKCRGWARGKSAEVQPGEMFRVVGVQKDVQR